MPYTGSIVLILDLQSDSFSPPFVYNETTFFFVVHWEIISTYAMDRMLVIP